MLEYILVFDLDRIGGLAMCENQVFVLPLNEETDIAGRAGIISLASTLEANLRVPLHPVDRIYSDPSYRNSQALASFIQYHSVNDYRICLWIITRHFTSQGQAMKMTNWYELAGSIIGPNTKLITVFLDSPGEEINGWISKLVQEASINTYYISSNNLKVSENREFANLSNTLYQILYRNVQEPPNCIHQYHQ